MGEPKNKSLYEEVKKDADKKFKSKSGIYRSSWIVKEYKKRGGKYTGSKNKDGLTRWYKEEWVDITRKNAKGYLKCGRHSTNTNTNNIYPVCRPSKRINSKTPRTYKEISKSSLKKAIKDKQRVKSKSNIKFGGSGAQYFGKKSKIMVKVPENVKKWAKYAFKLRDIGFRGALETGWKRAKQLTTKSEIPIEDIRYMRNWYARHIYTSYPGFKKCQEAGRPKDSSWHKKRSIISWITWGGDPGFRWINSNKIIKLLNKSFNKDYTKIKK
jgi:hypothetical protein